MNSYLQHAIKHVERPGGSHEGVGRKKNLSFSCLLRQLLDCVLVHSQHFCGFRQVDSPACVLKLQFNCLPRLNVCNDLAEAMKALDAKNLHRSHVLTTFLGRVSGAMMKQVCWHSRRSKAPEARGQSEAHGDSNLYNSIVGVPSQ